MDYLNIIEDKFWDNISTRHSDKGGVYRIHWFNSDQTPKNINRLLETDTQGVLYIGKAESFIYRVIMLKKTLIYKSGGHIAGRRINSLKCLTERIPLESLYISLVQSDFPSELEKKSIKEYVEKFGELPPLNRMN